MMEIQKAVHNIAYFFAGMAWCGTLGLLTNGPPEQSGVIIIALASVASFTAVHVIRSRSQKGEKG